MKKRLCQHIYKGTDLIMYGDKAKCIHCKVSKENNVKQAELLNIPKVRREISKAQQILIFFFLGVVTIALLIATDYYSTLLVHWLSTFKK